jgi:hypothetical protein
MKKYEEEMNKNDKLTGGTRRLRKRAQLRDKYEVLCSKHMVGSIY